MNILINEKINKNLWNGFIKNQINFNFNWYYVIGKVYKLKPLYVIIYDNEKFALIGSFKTLNGYLSLPYLNFSGFKSNDDSILGELKNFLNEKGLSIKCRTLVKFDSKYHYVNPILERKNFEDFWNSISSNMRNQFRKSLKYNFKFEIGYDLNTFYKIYSYGMHLFGTPLHNKNFFKKILELFDSKIFLVYYNNTPVSTMLTIKNSKSICIYSAFTLPEYNKIYANYFLYYNAIKYAFENKIHSIDFGRSSLSQGTFFFKKKFKPTLYSIQSENLNYNKKSFIIFSKIWKNIPISIANRLGPKLRKFLV